MCTITYLNIFFSLVMKTSKNKYEEMAKQN